MIQKENAKYYAPIVFFLLLLIDGQVTKSLESMMEGLYFANVHLLLLAFLMATNQLSKRYILIVTFFIGLIADSYYLGVLGIYTVSFMATVWSMYTFKNIVHTNLITEFFGMIIFVTLFEVIVVLLQVIFQLSIINPLLFITKVLGPTLLFNMFFFVIFAYPLKKLFSN